MEIRRSAVKNRKSKRPAATAAAQREDTLRKVAGASARRRTR